MSDRHNNRQDGARAATERTAELPAGVATAPDPRGLRVTVLGLADELSPLLLEPAAIPLGPAVPSTGQGLLGGITLAPPAGLPDATEVGLTADGTPIEATFERVDADRGILRLPGAADPRPAETHRVLLLDAGPTAAPGDGVVHREVIVGGWRFDVELEPAARAALRERARRGREEAGRTGPTEVHAIIPGVVVTVSVADGDQVEAGQQLLVVEAMKMQNELRAPREGTIEHVAVGPGTTIEVGDLLLVIA
jgi:biotin carboxyl carrier protein